MRAAYLDANLQAKDIVVSLKSGALLKGIVRSLDDSMDIAWIAIELPAIGDRQVAVKNAGHLKPGGKVVIQCVPNPSQPERYQFCVCSARAWKRPGKPRRALRRGSEVPVRHIRR
jgi:small nuclear ribonucleoprotein (snRNP)-like protein